MSEDDAPPVLRGSRVTWSPTPSENRPTLAGNDSDEAFLSDSASVHHASHHPGPIVSYRSADSRYQSRPTRNSEDAHSRSYISISSDELISPEAHPGVSSRRSVTRYHPAPNPKNRQPRGRINNLSGGPSSTETELDELREHVKQLVTERTELRGKLTELRHVSDLIYIFM
jgi:hypothetical protein